MPLIPGPTAGGGVTLVDSPAAVYQDVKAAAGTTAQVVFTGPAAPYFWWVDRITVKARAAVGTTDPAGFPASSSQAFVFVGTDPTGAVQDRYLADTTLVGNLDIADQNQPVTVDSGQVLVIVWTNTTPGAIYTARLQYRLMGRA